MKKNNNNKTKQIHQKKIKKYVKRKIQKQKQTVSVKWRRVGFYSQKIFNNLKIPPAATQMKPSVSILKKKKKKKKQHSGVKRKMQKKTKK